MFKLKTYAIPFISNISPSKTLYWSLYDDLSGGFFCTDNEVVPLASVLHLDNCRRVWEYLSLHGLLHEGVEITADKGKADYIKSLGKPVLTKLTIPKIVW